MDERKSLERTSGRAGVIVASDDATEVERLEHAVLDDVLYNVIHDLVMKVHMDEKTARATTAAIRVEKLASDASESSTPDSRPDIRVETDAAVYEDGKVTLKGNPLKTTKEILCPRCHLPRLLYPTDGKGARKPDPSIIYCKRQPYIVKPGYDIYGQTWVAQGPGRGKKKKDVEKAKQAAVAAAGETPADSPGKSPAPEQRPPNVLSYPSATCVKCKRCILVTRLNNHMGSCIGNSGRNASRAAAQKISNGANGSQNDGTPPSSQKGTPAPGSRAASPRKREASVLDEDDPEGSEAGNPKKKKPKTMAKKPILKIKMGAAGSLPGVKKEKVKGSSQLNIEQKADDPDAPAQPDIAPPKPKKAKAPSPGKKLKPPPSSGAKPPPVPLPAIKRDGDGESESSGTLSSPPN